MKRLFAAVLKGYRLVISPIYGQTCRYYPSCSAYALRAVEVHGAVKGPWLAARRIGRCHPWCEGGVDFVPTPATYRWWGRAEGTDGGDESRAEARADARPDGLDDVRHSAYDHRQADRHAREAGDSSPAARATLPPTDLPSRPDQVGSSLVHADPLTHSAGPAGGRRSPASASPLDALTVLRGV